MLLRVVTQCGNGNGVVDKVRVLGVMEGKALPAEQSGQMETVAEVRSFVSLAELAGLVASHTTTTDSRCTLGRVKLLLELMFTVSRKSTASKQLAILNC